MEQELEQVSQIYNIVVEFLVEYSFQIVGAIIVLIFGIIIGRKIGNLIFSLCQKKELDATLSRFFASCARVAIIAATVIVVLPKLGIQITPFIAAIGAVGLGAGLALQGLLSNYGAGLSIIITRPFIVGDTIKVQGVAGVVEEVHLAHTILTNEDSVRITIPNKHILGEIIHNSQADSILELSVGIAYSSDPKQAITVLQEALENIEGISEQRTPQVGIDQFGDSAIDIAIRVWVKTEKFFETRYRCNMAMHDALAKNNIAIPFPQREVRMLAE
ncbi:MAG: mechanosensitive ion channel family protein [Gammaproteobacteria bacterium]|nr:mechanosensitive ion channel family protein [Gammaproteobacteria bacterium]